jgi:hypothetical protein
MFPLRTHRSRAVSKNILKRLKCKCEINIFCPHCIKFWGGGGNFNIDPQNVVENLSYVTCVQMWEYIETSQHMNIRGTRRMYAYVARQPWFEYRQIFSLRFLAPVVYPIHRTRGHNSRVKVTGTLNGPTSETYPVQNVVDAQTQGRLTL